MISIARVVATQRPLRKAASNSFRSMRKTQFLALMPPESFDSSSNLKVYFSSNASQETNQNENSKRNVERGVLFSMPCIEPKDQTDLHEDTDNDNELPVEKGILFSAPCLDPRVSHLSQSNQSDSRRIEILHCVWILSIYL